MSTGALFHDEIAETTGVGVSLLMLSERVLARWWRLVAFMKATNLLHRVMRAVSYRRIATAIEMTSKGGGHFAHRCVDCRPGGRRGDTERVVASGFYESPGPPSSGDVLCISPAHRDGHRNGLRRRCICSPPPPISIAVMVAKGWRLHHHGDGVC
jgi:hypothetical protein